MYVTFISAFIFLIIVRKEDTVINGKQSQSLVLISYDWVLLLVIMMLYYPVEPELWTATFYWILKNNGEKLRALTFCEKLRVIRCMHFASTVHPNLWVSMDMSTKFEECWKEAGFGPLWPCPALHVMEPNGHLVVHNMSSWARQMFD